MNRHAGRCLMAAAVALAGAATAAAQAEDVVKKTLDAWSRKQRAIKSVRYTLSGTSERTWASLSEEAKKTFPRDKLRPTPIYAVILIDLEKARYRIECHQHALSCVVNDFQPEMLIHTWDGKELRSAMPRANNRHLTSRDPDVGIATGNLMNVHHIEQMFWPVFAAHGFVATVNTPLVPSGFPPRYDPDSFQHRGNVPLGGRSCCVLRTEPLNTVPTLTDELWVDPVRDYSVVRQVYLAGGLPAYRVDVDYKDAQGSALRKWVGTSLRGSQLDQVAKLSVDTVEINPGITDPDFSISLDPGMRVETYRYPEAGRGLDPVMPSTETFTVTPEGVLKPTGEATGFVTISGKQLPPQLGWPWWLWVVIVVGFTGILCGVGIWVRWRLSRRLAS